MLYEMIYSCTNVNDLFQTTSFKVFIMFLVTHRHIKWDGGSSRFQLLLYAYFGMRDFIW